MHTLLKRFRWISGRRSRAETPIIDPTEMPIIGPKDTTGYDFLDFQHFILRRVLGGNHQSPLSAPQRILDAGCGTGRWLVEMAQEFPGAEVVGVDLVPPDSLAPMLAPLGDLAEKVTFVEADLRHQLPFPDASFDFAHMRLMHGALLPEQYHFALGELVRVTRPGGWVECTEPGEVLYNVGPIYQVLIQWTVSLLRSRGLDPDLGPKLQRLLRQAGVAEVTGRIVASFPDLAMTRERRMWQAQAIGAFETPRAREPILAAGVTTVEAYDWAIAAARQEFASGQYANSDMLYVAFGQR
jgi:ubiquinone/menaquinone biosynthesis C-methylase UbiE